MKWVKNSSMLVARYLSSGSTGVTNNSHMFIIGLAARPQNTHHLGDGDSGRLCTFRNAQHCNSQHQLILLCVRLAELQSSCRYCD